MSATTEKKPLLIQIPGEITPNVLPVSASAVGYDFVQGNYIYYATGSDSWVTAPPNGGGGSSPEYWFSTGSNETYTTGSVLIRGGISNSRNLIEFDVSGSGFIDNFGNSWDGGSAIKVKDVDVADPTYSSISGALFLMAANVATSGAGGLISIQAGNSGYISASNYAPYGGVIELYAGAGGINADADTNAYGGPGGEIILYAGAGGEGYSNTGEGGSVSVGAGMGGTIIGLNTSDPANGGPGGSVNFSAGEGGFSQFGGTKGIGGKIRFFAGPGGSGDGELGQAGDIIFRGGDLTQTQYAASASLVASRLTFGITEGTKPAPFRIVSFNHDAENYVEANYPDVFFYVSGAVGAKGTSERGVAVFAGDTVVSGVLYAEKGLSGSLTKLTDGTSYIIAGSGIGVSSASNGAITISATGGGGTPGGSFNQIQYNNSGNFGGVTNLTWDGATLNATGSFKGNLDGTSSYATNAATASYVQNAVTASYATVAVSLTTTIFNVALNGSAPGVSTNVGGIYIPATTTVTTKSLAYIGGSTVTEVAVLKMIPINSITVSASWIVTGTLTSVSLSNAVTLGPGWYDLTLETGTVSQTAFGRGLYLTSGDI